MKKLFTFLLIMFMCTQAHGAIITFDSGATITDAWLDNTFYGVYNDYNGNIESVNLATGAVTSDDIATAANPLVRDQENIGEYVYTGLLPTAPGSGLAMTTPLGTAYITNDGDSTLHRVVTAATANTYTASKDTYVSLDFAGSFTYTEVATGAAQPTTPSNSIILFKVVADGSDITSVTDLRQTTPPNLRVYTDYIAACVLSRDISDADEIEIGRGEIDFGTGSDNLRRNTSAVEINFDVTGRGGLDTGTQLANTFYYIHAVPDDDNSSNFEGIASLSSSDASGVTSERLIGWVYSPTTSLLSPDSVGAYRGRGGDAPNAVFRGGAITGNLPATTWAQITPINTKFYSSGRPVQVIATLSGANAGGGALTNATVIEIDGVSIDASRCNAAHDGAAETVTWVSNWLGRMSEGEHTVSLQGVAFGAETIPLERFNITIIEQ